MTSSELEFDGAYPVEWTRFGFHWGPAVVERVAVLPTGAVVLYIAGTDGENATSGPNQGVQIYVSPKGRRIRVEQGA